MSNTEAPFVVSHNFCAVRADTPEELLAKLNAFNATPNVQAAISQFRDTVSNQPSRPAEPLQGVVQATAPVVEAPMQIAPDVAAAVNNIQAAGMTGQIIPAGIEERNGKWHNKPNPELYQSGHDIAPVCLGHSQKRIHKAFTTKAGEKKKGWVCVHDSPFGNWREKDEENCKIVWIN